GLVCGGDGQRAKGVHAKLFHRLGHRWLPQSDLGAAPSQWVQTPGTHDPFGARHWQGVPGRTVTGMAQIPTVSSRRWRVDTDSRVAKAEGRAEQEAVAQSPGPTNATASRLIDIARVNTLSLLIGITVGS